METAVGYDKTDAICDRYFKRSLKNLTQKGRGGGSIFDIGKEKEILSDFKENLLKKTVNKKRLNFF